MGEKLLLNLADLAELIGVSTMSVRRYFAAGWLPKPSKLGGRLVWQRDVIEQWVAAGCPSAEEQESTKEAV